jgi:nucleotide-binding universal stress UspA family protein
MAVELDAIEHADHDLGEVAKQLEAEGVVADARVPYGVPAEAILDEATFECADLIVMSTHARGGFDRLVHGSVADHVIHTARVPVLVVPPGAPGGWGSGARRVLVTLDGSALAEEAIGPADELARTIGASIVLMKVIEPFYYGYAYGDVYGTSPMLDVDPEAELKDARAYLREVARTRLTGQRVEIVAEIGKPEASIVETAHRLGASAIAMATHGRGGFARFMIGSVATGVLRHAEAPLLLVRPAAAPSRREVASALEVVT